MHKTFFILTLVAAASAAYARQNLPAAPEEFVKLLQVDPRGGKVVRPANFNLTQPGAAWNNWPGAHMVYEPLYQNYGCYRAQLDEPPAPKSGERPKRLMREIWSSHGIQVHQNRNYIVSVLVKTDFDRKAVELNVKLRLFDKYGNRLPPNRPFGLPAVTHGPDGWQRLEWKMTTHTDPRIHEARASMLLVVYHGDKPVELRMADFAFVELPPLPLEALPRGQGVTFPGGPGDLPMKIVSANERDGHLIVETTGAKYDFDLTNNVIIAGQRIEFPRELAKWRSSLSLAGLQVDKKTDDVCVLSNDQLTIGIQCDSLMVISPQHELRMELTNLLGGDWNRYARGSLLSEDDFGGFTVTPYIPSGTGLKPQSELLTQGLSFESLTPLEALHEHVAQGKKIHRIPWSSEKPGAAQPGWQARWTTRPGELFCTSVFPPRPYPWEESFTKGWKQIRRHDELSSYNKPQPRISSWLLWDFTTRVWGQSFSIHHTPVDAEKLRKVIKAGHDLGLDVIPYLSAFWIPSDDPEVYIDSVRQFKEQYGIDGVYSDGIPSTDWMVAYKEMRMLRALFPSGTLIIHDSIPQDGWAISQFKPFVLTYATFSFLAENMESDSGIHWQYIRYVTSQFRKANALGAIVGNAWRDSKGKLMSERGLLTALIYNGRYGRGWPKPTYEKVLSELHDLWKEKGDQPHFYDRYFLPTAQNLTGYKLGRAGMPIVERKKEGTKVILTLKSLTPGAIIHYTIDGTIPTKDSPRYAGPITVKADAAIVSARAFAEDLDPSAVAKVAPSKESSIP